jgi:hypothetical protein
MDEIKRYESQEKAIVERSIDDENYSQRITKFLLDYEEKSKIKLIDINRSNKDTFIILHPT